MMYEKVPMESFWEFHFCIFPLAVILFCVEFVIPLKPINIVLAFFGKHSMNVFLIHTFFLSGPTGSVELATAISKFLLISSDGFISFAITKQS